VRLGAVGTIVTTPFGGLSGSGNDCKSNGEVSEHVRNLCKCLLLLIRKFEVAYKANLTYEFKYIPLVVNDNRAFLNILTDCL